MCTPALSCFENWLCVLQFYLHILLLLPAFSLIRDFGKQTPALTFPKFPSVLCVINRSDRNPPITATSVTFRPSLRRASGCNWWISIQSVDNMYVWRKFWKRFRGCFVFQSRESTKTLVNEHRTLTPMFAWLATSMIHPKYLINQIQNW